MCVWMCICMPCFSYSPFREITAWYIYIYIYIYIVSIVRKHQLRLCEYVARYPEADSASWVISERDNPEWRRPKGRPQSSWLGQVDASCWELISMGWGLARADRQSWRQRIGEATHLSVYAPND